MTEWRIDVRDKYLNRIGEVDEFDSLTLTPRYNEVGTWELKLDRRARVAADITEPGAGIVVWRDNTVVLSGPTDTRRHTVSADERSINLRGWDDLAYVGFDRSVSPAPAESLPPYTTQAYDLRGPGVASTILRQYVDVNVGPGAAPNRRNAVVTIGADPLVGATTSGSGRWQDDLLILLQQVATSGGVGFRCRQVANNVEFQVYAPINRTNDVKFSIENENLEAYTYESTRPTANYIYVLGSGEGTARVVYEKASWGSIATWGRIERVVDRRDTADVVLLEQAADEALAEGAEKFSLSITPIDTPQLVYGTHYDLGDRVTVIPEDDTTAVIQEIVREIVITITPDGQTTHPGIGTPGSGDIARLFRAFRAQQRRINRLEAR